jgi:hypothetical protein
MKRLAMLLLTSLVATVGFTTVAAGAAAAGTPRVSFSPGTADPDYATSVQLRGTGFQSVKNGFGGIYVLFGWVDTKWRPSEGGASGVDFRYVQDTETRNNHGFQRFISFPGDPTAYAANGGEVAADGTWSTSLVIPGATFPAQGRNGGVEQIDCRQVQCGVITIGGHGVVSPANESFTPISFAVPVGNAAPAVSQPAPTAAATKVPPVAAVPTAAVTTKAAAPVATASPGAAPTPSATKAVTEVNERAVASKSSVSSSAIGWLVAVVVAFLLVAFSSRWWLRRRGKGRQA